MYLKSFILVLLLVSYSAISAENDFDRLCDYFEKLDKAPTINIMSKSQKFAFINKFVVEGLPVNSSARKTWEVVFYAVPEERYGMVQATSMELLKKSWKCNVMKKHISNVGG